MTSAPEAALVSRGEGRWRSLDGLRGIAAVVVLLHHGLLTLGSLADAYYVSDRPDPFTPVWWLAWTPLHLVWEGTGAVLVFFVLSGFVLTLAVVRSPRFSWIAYYPARLVRLMVPVWAAVCLGIVLMTLVPRDGDGGSAWVRARAAVGVSPETVWQSLTLSAPAGRSYLVSPLWSLHFEVVFSLLLPLFVASVIATRRRPVLAVGVALAAVAVSGMMPGKPTAFYAMFLVGTILAVHRDRLATAAARFSARPPSRVVWPAALLIGLVLLTWRWITLSVDLGSWSGFVDIPASVGAVLVVFVCAHWRGVDRVLTRRPVLWLGTISFSLYLVHEPIVIAASYVFPPEARYAGLIVGYVASFVAAWLFFLAIERPAHRLSRRVSAWGSAVSSRRAARRESPAVRSR